MKWLAKRFFGKAMGVLVCVMALALIEGHVAGQCVEDQKIFFSGEPQIDAFGGSVSISGTSRNKVAIVGAPGGTSFSHRFGAAFIYRFNGVNWVEQSKLLASDGQISDAFGWSVSITGTPGNEVAIVGAPLGRGASAISGTAYIYRFNGINWVEEQKLLPSDRFGSLDLGRSVSISGTRGNEIAIVGASLGRGNSRASGTAFIFRFNGVSWVEEAKLLDSDGALFDRFGKTVSISGTPGNEIAIVGVPCDDDNGKDSGSAYIYRFNGVNWIEEQKLPPSDGAAGEEFGISVSIGGTPGNEVAMVGVPGDDDNGPGSGAAYIYRFNGASWVEEQKILASDAAKSDVFGKSVSIGGTHGNEIAIVGAWGDDDNGLFSGSAYVFRKTGLTWDEEDKLLASDGAMSDFFGWSVSISGTHGNEAAIVGAPEDGIFLHNSGSAYIYELPCSPACSADLNDDGFVNVADLLLLLGARDHGPPPGPPGSQGDRPFNVTDLLALLAAWGPCP